MDHMPKDLYSFVRRRAGLIHTLPAWEKLQEDVQAIYSSDLRQLLFGWGLCLEEIADLERGGKLRVEKHYELYVDGSTELVRCIRKSK